MKSALRDVILSHPTHPTEGQQCLSLVRPEDPTDEQSRQHSCFYQANWDADPILDIYPCFGLSKRGAVETPPCREGAAALQPKRLLTSPQLLSEMSVWGTGKLRGLKAPNA